MSRKSKNKKKIPKLKDDEAFGINIGEGDSETIFKDFLDNEFDPGEKFSEEKADYSDSPSIETRREEKGFKNVKEDEIDLHGLSSSEAVFAVKEYIEERLIHCNILKLKIITGRGVSSGVGGPVLAREVHQYISETYKKKIIKIEASPANSMIGNTSIRGYFWVHIKS